MDVKVGDKVVLRAYPDQFAGLDWTRDDPARVSKIFTVKELDSADVLYISNENDYTTWPMAFVDLLIETSAPTPTKHAHYFKSVKGLTHIDVYRVLQLFNVTDPCIQHAVKKLLVAGGRGAEKDINRDIQESIDTLVRWQEMQTEGVNHAPAV